MDLKRHSLNIRSQRQGKPRIRSDHNVDNSSVILTEWVTAVRAEYHDIDLKIDDSVTEYEGEKTPCDWTDERFNKVIALREEALVTARKIWADYLFMIDADVILENTDTLNVLLEVKQTVVAPMMNSSVGTLYSNFWGGMTDEGYYKRVSGYFDVVKREKIGVFECPMVHSAILIDMRHIVTEQFSYSHKPAGYGGPHDDIIIFAYSVKATGEKMHVINSEYFGIIMVPLDDFNTIEDEAEQFVFAKLEAMVFRPPLIKSPYIDVPEKIPDKLDFDEIYMINLKRRPERRIRMIKSLQELGLTSKIIDAIDGKELNTTYLKKLGVEMLPGYADPYVGRKLTMGEIGCFLSHYFIWKDILEKGYKKVIVFEDDVRFEPYFRTRTKNVMKEVEERVPDWELLYLGRKRMRRDLEKYVDGTENLVWPSYSYWTLGYALSDKGAKKLIDQEPLGKMIPVDEYLPIMFNQHPENSWRLSFEPRNLRGLSVHPFYIYPTHYTGEPNYISDTEDSHIIPPDQEMEEKMSEGER
ncbi:hypothetical protein FSP39_019538 [Pinctada imbricata]|uniref:Glycosyl transferase family 25 domain-containing protein n=1 Tax=Pinctada imbricata TaxID=66713 RepID=A0AA89BMN6_PINIB|nr:hypothetical protein FSP39_019538 [Pinctada imbricata]